MKKNKNWKYLVLGIAMTISINGFGLPVQAAQAADHAKKTPIVLEDQGSYAVGGRTITHAGQFEEKNFLSEDGQSAYGDHAYVFYQIPINSSKYPLVFQHGGAQTKRTWETTPDGRDGFQNIFLRKGYSVYLLDQPRSGESNLSTEAKDPSTPWGANPMYGDHTLYMLSRVGHYPDGVHPEVLPGSQFPSDTASFDQFQRAWNIGTGPLDNDVNADAVASLLEKIGPSVLVTHSMGGTIGWRTPLRTDKVKAIVAWEPGGTPFLFPENEMPKENKAVYAPLSASAIGIPEAEFEKLAKVPMILFYGDFIPDHQVQDVGPDKWRTEYEMAKQFAAAVNRHGGDATIVHLPDIGIHGNSHFLMGDRNNGQLANLMADWLHKKGLDQH